MFCATHKNLHILAAGVVSHQQLKIKKIDYDDPTPSH
jgi:hypothetical protein